MSAPIARLPAVFAIVALFVGCGSSSGGPAEPQLQIVTVSGAPLHAVAGDAVPLEVIIVAADGTTQDLPAGASVTWTVPGVVDTLPPGSTAQSPLPTPNAEPTATFVDNAGRPDRDGDLTNVLFILDPGAVQNATLQVTATVTGASPSGTVVASIAVDPTPAGDWTNGATLYAASCAECHGSTGHGSPGAPSASTYTMGGGTYDFPAPGINAEPGNMAGDPAWSPALFAVAARADMNNGGVTLRLPMPDWLAMPDPATGQPFTTQDFADMFAFLKTQTH